MRYLTQKTHKVPIVILVMMLIGFQPVFAAYQPARPAATEQQQDKGVMQKFSDVLTTASIKTRLFLNGSVHAHGIHVDTHNGEVSLNGEVGTVEEKVIAEDIAMRRSGVSEVHNNLKISGQKESG